MKLRSGRALFALHACVLALVMLGLLLRPILDLATELHLTAHAVAAEHVLADADAEGGASCSKDAALEQAHGLTHQESSGSLWADTSVQLRVPVLAFAPVFGSTPAVVDIPTRHLATPFKPPIG